MNRLIIVIATMLLASVLNAQGLEVSKPVLFGKTPVKVKQYDRTAKKWLEVEGYGYSFVFHLKNTSDKQITVATGGLSQQTSSAEPKQNVIITMEKMTVANGGGLVVPSRSDLKLVDIRPGEVAMMKAEFKMAVPLQEVKITYNPLDFYDGRFGYWTGKVVSESAVIDPNEK